MPRITQPTHPLYTPQNAKEIAITCDNGIELRATAQQVGKLQIAFVLQPVATAPWYDRLLRAVSMAVLTNYAGAGTSDQETHDAIAHFQEANTLIVTTADNPREGLQVGKQIFATPPALSCGIDIGVIKSIRPTERHKD